MSKLVHEAETYEILGACFEVYRDMGCGFLEAVFQECLSMEFGLRRIPASSQVPLPLAYTGRPLRMSYVADFVCYDMIVVELKAVSTLVDEHRAQMQNYLHATKLRVGLWSISGTFPNSNMSDLSSDFSVYSVCSVGIS